MATTLIGTGKLGFRYRQGFDPTASYELQDLVSYNNSIYIYINGVAQTGITPVLSNGTIRISHWQLYSQSSNSIATTTQTLIYHDGTNLNGFSSGSIGQILTATSRKILEYDVTINSGRYHLTDVSTGTGVDQLRVELTDGDIVTFNIDHTIATNSPFILGTDTMSGNELDSSHGVDYRVNGQSFPTHSTFIHRLENVSVSSASLIWEVPTGFGASSNAVYYDSKSTALGGAIGIMDYTTASNPIELKWRSYVQESPRKVMALPNSRRSTTLNFAAFIMKDNSVRTIGNGSRFRHGNGSEENTEYPSLVGFPKTFPGVSSIQIAPNASLVYVIDTNNELWMWGTGNVGEHGQGGAALKEFPVPEKITNLPGNVLDIADIHSSNLSVSASKDNNCTMVLVNDSGATKLYSSGYNQYGQLGQGGTSHNSTTTFGLVDMTNFGSNTITSVCGTGGNERTFFALDHNHNLYSWGSNSYGTLGQNTLVTGNVNSVPTKIPYFEANGISISKIITARYSAFAIDTNNKLYVWGSNYYGFLGLGSGANLPYNEPQYVADDVADVFTASYDNEIAFLLMTDGTLRSSGDVSYGANGQGISAGDSVLTFTDVTTSSNIPISNVSKVMIGGTGIFRSSALLKNDGTVMVCGYNGEGQLGLGDTATRTRFEELKVKEYIKDIHWFGSSKNTVLTLHTENDDVYICGAGIEGLNTQLRGSNYLVPTPLIF